MQVNRRRRWRRTEDAGARDRLKRAFASVAVGYLILMGAGAYALYALEHRDRNRLHDAATASCHRVNVLRAQENENALVIYGALYSGLKRQETLAAKTHGPQREVARRGVKALRVYTAALEQTRLTDCRQAVDNPTHYAPPAPRPFRPADLKGSGLLVR